MRFDAGIIFICATCGHWLRKSIADLVMGCSGTALTISNCKPVDEVLLYDRRLVGVYTVYHTSYV